MFGRFFPVATFNYSSFILIAIGYSILWIFLLIHSSIARHVGGFLLADITNTVAKSILVSLGECAQAISVGYIPNNEITALKRMCI